MSRGVRTTALREDVIKAAQKAQCHDFISALSKGYDTIIGEAGDTISGGEKQRISIARALLKNAPIIILDEATGIYKNFIEARKKAVGWKIAN